MDKELPDDDVNQGSTRSGIFAPNVPKISASRPLGFPYKVSKFPMLPQKPSPSKNPSTMPRLGKRSHPALGGLRIAPLEKLRRNQHDLPPDFDPSKPPPVLSSPSSGANSKPRKAKKSSPKTIQSRNTIFKFIKN
jgi:hypothetical protein